VLSYIHNRPLNTDPHIVKVSVCSGSYVGYFLNFYRYKYVYVCVCVFVPCIFLVEFPVTVSTAKVFVKIINKISL